jgi:hypothetical protein
VFEGGKKYRIVTDWGRSGSQLIIKSGHIKSD